MSTLVDVRSPLSDQQRDYMLMTVFVFARSGQTRRAKQIVDGLLAIGERSTRVRTAQAVLAFLVEDYALTLNCLDRLDSDLQEGRPQDDEAVRMRQYLRARCYHNMGREREACDIAAEILNAG